jgi:hypothetical protein
METRLVLFYGLALHIALLLPLGVKGSEYTTIVCDATSTVATSINASQQIVGYCGNSGDNAATTGFVRFRNGELITFRAPHAAFQTFAVDNNDDGAITGYYTATSGKYHGFVRNADGTYAEFDPPNSTGTFPASINSEGVIVGTY